MPIELYGIKETYDMSVFSFYSIIKYIKTNTKDNDKKFTYSDTYEYLENFFSGSTISEEEWDKFTNDNNSNGSCLINRNFVIGSDDKPAYRQKRFLEKLSNEITVSLYSGEEIIEKMIYYVNNELIDTDNSNDLEVAESIIKSFTNKSSLGIISENKELALIYQSFIKEIDADKNMYKFTFPGHNKYEDVPNTIVCIAWIMLISLFPNWINKVAQKNKRLWKDYSPFVYQFITKTKWKKYILSKNTRSDTENYDAIQSNNKTIAALKTAAEEMIKRAKEDCRLLPFQNGSNASGCNEHIQLPNLDVDSTLNSENNIYSLKDLIYYSNHNIMITGGGGCGKTYSLLHCANEILSQNEENNIIPLYIPLNNFNGFDFNGIESYIIDRIKVSYHNNFSIAEQNYYNWLEERRENGSRLLLLCDGFNEVVNKELQSKIVHDIKELQHKDVYKIIITSRYNLSSTFTNVSGDLSNTRFKPYKMNDLDDSVVEEYVRAFLEEQGKDTNDIDLIINTKLCTINSMKEKRVKDIYKKPMALVMFCGIYSNTKEKYGISNPNFYYEINKLGELLHNFIMCLKIGNRAVDDVKNKHEDFLCYLGYNMNVDGVFTISKAQFNDYCERFISLFKQTDMSSQSIFENTFVNDVMKYEHENGMVNQISFNHQNYRDYLAASFLRKIISDNDCGKINSFIGIDKKIPYEVNVLLAELLGEYRNIMSNEESKSIVQILLTNNSSHLTSSAVAFLIQTVIIGRNNDLSTFNFSELDLSLTHLNGVILSKGSSDKKAKAIFNNATITKETFAPIGHAGAPRALLYIEERYIITFAKGGIYAFDMETGVHKLVAPYGENLLYTAVLIPHSNKIVTGDSAGILSLWKYNNDNNTIELSLVKDKNLLNSVYLLASEDKKDKTEIQDMDIYDEKIIFSLGCGDVFTIDYDLNTLELKMDIFSKTNCFKRLCRIECCGKDFYVAYGDRVYKNDINHYVSFSENQRINGGYIYDFVLINKYDFVSLIVNYRDKENKFGEKSSVIYKINDNDFDDGYNDNCVEIYELPHALSSQGFKGWNKFSQPFENYIYLTVNTNDTIEEAELYMLSFDFKYDDEEDDEDIIDVCVELQACPGNSHIMSVERALPFKYNKRNYIATTSLDRSVEILDISGVENTLIYHLQGHTDGVTCMKVVNDNTIYTSHYSGEVCKWHKSKSKQNWKCTIMSKPHNNWVWAVDHAKVITGEGKFDNYIIGSSYDHNISVTNAKTGEYFILDGCKGRIKSFEFISDNTDALVASYDYKENGNSKFEMKVFNGIDFSLGKSIDGKVIEAPGSGYIRCMKNFNDKLHLCVNNDIESSIYCIDISKLQNPEISDFVQIKTIRNKGHKPQMRAMDIIEENGEALYVSGGNMGDFFAAIWDSKKEAYIVDRPSNILINGKSYTDDDGISVVKFVRYDGNIYLFIGAFDHHIYTYKVDIDDNIIQIKPISVCEHSDKVLNLQYLDENKMIYVSLLNGKVFGWNLEDLLNQEPMLKKENKAKLLFHAVTGLHIMGINFADCHQNIDKEFQKVMSYYSTII